MGPKNLRARKQYIYEKALEYGAEGVISREHEVLRILGL